MKKDLLAVGISILLLTSILFISTKALASANEIPVQAPPGYIALKNGTSTILIKDTPNAVLKHDTFFHNVTLTGYNYTLVEVNSTFPSAICDNSTGKYYLNVTVPYQYEVRVPDMEGTVTVAHNEVFNAPQAGLGVSPDFSNSSTGTSQVSTNTRTWTTLLPYNVSQAILHIVGHNSTDPWLRNLEVTVNGRSEERVVYPAAFNVTIDFTADVKSADVNYVEIMLSTQGEYDSTADAFFSITAGSSDVYILDIAGYQAVHITNIAEAVQGVEDACMVKPLVHLSNFAGLTYVEMNSMDEYESLILNPEIWRPSNPVNKIITVVNAHGENLPVPSDYTWQAWIDLISSDCFRNATTWVQITGYPFYYVQHPGGGTPTLLDSYSESNYNTQYTMDAQHPSSTSAKSSAGQSFKTPNNGVSYYLAQAKFYIGRTGSPTGTIRAALYAHSGTYGSSSKPTGSALTYSSTIDISTLNPNWNLVTFSFDGTYLMSPNTAYCIAWEIVTYPFHDGSNRLNHGLDTTYPAPLGNEFYYSSSAWHADSGYDSLFYVYGTASGGGGDLTTIGGAGLQRFAQTVLGSNNLTCSFSNENKELYVQNDYYGRLQGYGLLDLQLNQGRAIDVSKTPNGYGIGSILNLMKYNASSGNMDKWTSEGTGGWATYFDTQNGYNGGVLRSPSGTGTSDARVRASAMSSSVADSMTDFNLKLNSGPQDWWIGVRYNPITGNEYFFEYVSSTHTLYLWKHKNGGNTMLASTTSLTISTDQWHSVMVKIWTTAPANVTLQFYFDGALTLQKTNEAYDISIAQGVIQFKADGTSGGVVQIDNPRVFSQGVTNSFEFFDDFEYKEMGLFLWCFTKPQFTYNPGEGPGYFAFCGAWGSDYAVGKAAMTCAAWPKINTLTSHSYLTSGPYGGSYVESISWAYCYFDGTPRVGLVHAVSGADKNSGVSTCYAPLQITTTFGRATMQVMKGVGTSQRMTTTAGSWEFLINVGGIAVGLWPVEKSLQGLKTAISTALSIAGMPLYSTTSESGTSINIQWDDTPTQGQGIKQMECWGVVRADFLYGNTETFTFTYGQQAYNPVTGWWGDQVTQSVVVTVGNAGR